MHSFTLNRHRLYADTDRQLLLPSVTTVLDHTKPSFIQRMHNQWRKTTSSKEQSLILSRGNAFHLELEQYFQKDLSSSFQFHNVLAKQLKDANYFASFKKVVGIEQPVAYRKGGFRFAGRADLFVQHKDGHYVVVDFKSSKKKKTLSQCKDYFLQGVAYALAFWDEIPQNTEISILISYTEPQGKRNPTLTDRYTCLISDELITAWFTRLGTYYANFEQEYGSLRNVYNTYNAF